MSLDLHALTMRISPDLPNHHVTFDGLSAHHGATYFGDNPVAAALVAREMLVRWNLWAGFDGDPAVELARLREVDAQWQAITNKTIEFRAQHERSL